MAENVQQILGGYCANIAVSEIVKGRKNKCYFGTECSATIFFKRPTHLYYLTLQPYHEGLSAKRVGNWRSLGYIFGSDKRPKLGPRVLHSDQLEDGVGWNWPSSHASRFIIRYINTAYRD